MKAFSLIELIFTVVIIGLVFSVIPRIIEVSNKSLEFAKKEDAIFNLMAKAMDISTQEFDENNTQTDDILLVNDPLQNVLDCNSSSGYRVGGFSGSRNCKNGYFVSKIGSDSDEPPYDDVDDYNLVEENTTNDGRIFYTLKMYAGYTDEFKSYNNSSLDFNFTEKMDSNKTNIKRVYLQIFKDDNEISSISYDSANIGHISIESKLW
jgi:hypothetical protein